MEQYIRIVICPWQYFSNIFMFAILSCLSGKYLQYFSNIFTHIYLCWFLAHPGTVCVTWCPHCWNLTQMQSKLHNDTLVIGFKSHSFTILGNFCPFSWKKFSGVHFSSVCYITPAIIRTCQIVQPQESYCGVGLIKPKITRFCGAKKTFARKFEVTTG